MRFTQMALALYGIEGRLLGVLHMNWLHHVCAWCGRDLGSKLVRGQGGTGHGMCPPCFERISSQL